MLGITAVIHAARRYCSYYLPSKSTFMHACVVFLSSQDCCFTYCLQVIRNIQLRYSVDRHSFEPAPPATPFIQMSYINLCNTLIYAIIILLGHFSFQVNGSFNKKIIRVLKVESCGYANAKCKLCAVKRGKW